MVVLTVLTLYEYLFSLLVTQADLSAFLPYRDSRLGYFLGGPRADNRPHRYGHHHRSHHGNADWQRKGLTAQGTALIDLTVNLSILI